jgi:hypothetical protein
MMNNQIYFITFAKEDIFSLIRRKLIKVQAVFFFSKSIKLIFNYLEPINNCS